MSVSIKELKSCPFCGGHPEFKEISVYLAPESIKGFEIQCKCGIKTVNKIYDYDGKTIEDLMSKLADIWNKRV